MGLFKYIVQRTRVFVDSKATPFLERFDYVKRQHEGYPEHEEFERMYREIKPYTMTSAGRVYGLQYAVEYIVENNIPGSIVECGVWRGGSMMAAIRVLQSLGQNDREIYLYDTFEGNTKPTEVDVSAFGSGEELFEKHRTGQNSSTFCYAPLQEVQKNILGTGYSKNSIHFIKGPVEETLPGTLPGPIALLRLDTDWYESTRRELVHLFPLLVPGGVLIIDDYGTWRGSQKATDEYFSENKVPILLYPMDSVGRIGIKHQGH